MKENVKLHLCAIALSLCALPAVAQTDLSRWKLTLPVDSTGRGAADEVKGLAGVQRPPWFEQEGPALRFRAVAGGARTSARTAYARSELREMAGGREAGWDCLAATRTLSLEQRLLETPLAKPEVTIGQIHDLEQDNLMLKYVGPAGADGHTDTGRVELLWNDGRERAVLDPAYTLGQRMQVRIAAAGGVVQVSYRNQGSGLAVQREARLNPAQIAGACYFKAGVYIQACSLVDLQGKANAVCAKKGWQAGRYDAPQAAAELVIERAELE